MEVHRYAAVILYPYRPWFQKVELGQFGTHPDMQVQASPSVSEQAILVQIAPAT